MPDHDRPWDAIVVGSGLGGLAAGAAFARKGKRVLVLERLPNFGGAATIYRHGSLTMEASLHETDGDTIFGPTSAFVQLGLQSAVEPVATDLFYEVRSSVFAGPVRVPHRLDAAEAELARCFPEARAGLDRYFATLRRLRLSMLDLSGSNGRGAFIRLVVSGRLFELVRLRRRTLAEQLCHLLLEARARQARTRRAACLFRQRSGKAFLHPLRCRYRTLYRERLVLFSRRLACVDDGAHSRRQGSGRRSTPRSRPSNGSCSTSKVRWQEFGTREPTAKSATISPPWCSVTRRRPR